MRQAVTKTLVGLCVILAAPARGEGPPTNEPPIIARARRLIQAGDREAGVNLLEDALIDGPAGERPAVVAFLRRSYEAMAREAEAAGRTEVAARYREDLAILGRAHEGARPAPVIMPRVEPARPRVEPARPIARPSSPDRDAKARMPDPASIQPPSAGEEPPAASFPPELRAPLPDPALSEPAALPEPAKLPRPGPAAQAPPAADTGRPARVPPRSMAAIGPAPASSPATPATRPNAPVPDEADAGEVLINPGEAIAAADPAQAHPATNIAPVANPGPMANIAPVTNPAPAAVPAPTPKAAAVPASAPKAAMPGPASSSSELATADQFFRSQNFDEAGRIYAALAVRELLPADRRPHWAYCRFKAVVRRINAGPRSAREWDAIEEEVRSIQRLTPGNWYGEYLINKITEARRSRKRRGGTPENVVVRGSSPDDPSPAPQPQAAPRRQGLFGRSRGTPAAPAAPASGPPAPPADDRPLDLPGTLNLPEDPSSGAGSPSRTRSEGALGARRASGSGDGDAASWQVHESPNFRIYHRDPALAERVAAVAESVRAAQARRWGGGATRAAWSPRCELYLYPDARAFAAATGQPEMSPGLSSMSNDGVRVLSRRMSLRADNPLLLTATLPHEVTHIVLADLFVAQVIPRWADEGLAVLAEPDSERLRRQADLKAPLDAGRVFELGPMMAMDYPDAKDWRLFYAQSVSLTQFLVEQGPPERFIRFVRDTQRIGTEAALRDVYQIEGLAALQERWLDYARKQVAVDVASSRDAAAAPEGVVRD